MVKFTSEAFSDIENFKKEVRKTLLNKIEEQLKGSREDPEITVIRRPSYDAEFPRLKITANELNHRIYFDYIDSELYLFAIRHREHAYTPEDIEQAVQRLKQLKKL